MRKRIWLIDPLCGHCRLITVYPSGFELDHRIALTNGGTNDDSNLQVLHHECHEAKTNADLGYAPKIATGADGWPVEQSDGQMRSARWARAAKGRRK